MVQTVFGAYRTTDFNEGRGYMTLECAFLAKADAERYTSSQPGIQGIKGAGWDVREVRLYEDFNEVYEKQVLDKKRKALEKLTEEEQELLGLV